MHQAIWGSSFRDQVIARLNAIDESLEQLHAKVDQVMTEQQDIDNATAELTAIVSDVQGQIAALGTDFTAIQTEIANLEAQVAAGQPVNTAALNAAVAAAQSTLSGLDPAVAQIGTLAPPPAPPAGP